MSFGIPYHYAPEPKKPYDGQKKLFEYCEYDTLDLTAGYRFIHRTKKLKDLGHVLFIDIRKEVKPDILCSNEFLPFRDDTFKRTIYDPPHFVQDGDTYYRTDFGRRYWAWRKKSQMQANLFRVNIEAARVAKRMILKWTETPDGLPIMSVLSLLDNFIQESKQTEKSGSGHSKNVVWWVNLCRKHTQ